jgi:putative zinc finger protein
MMPSAPHISDGNLAAYLDGELAQIERRRVAGHLSLCADCRSRMAGVSAGRTAVHALPEEAAPELTWDRLSAKLQANERPIPRRMSPARWAIAASIVLLSVALAISLGDLPGSGAQEETRAAVQAVDLGLYLNDLDHPLGESRFENAYRVVPASWERAVRSAGVEFSGPLERIPSDYVFSKAHLVSGDAGSPTARLRFDGPSGRVEIFCQKRDLPHIFSGFLPVETRIREKPCTSVICTRYRAISFSTSEGTFTVVGARSSRDLESLVETMLW